MRFYLNGESKIRIINSIKIEYTGEYEYDNVVLFSYNSSALKTEMFAMKSRHPVAATMPQW